MISLCDCNPFLRTAMIQDSVMEGTKPRIPYDNRIFLVYSGNATIILNDKEIPITHDSLIFLSRRDEYRFKGKIRSAVLNFDMTTSCNDRKTPICPVPKELYDKNLVFDKSVTEGFQSAVVITADETLKRQITDLVDLFIRQGDFTEVLCSIALKKILVDILIFMNAKKSAKTTLAENIYAYIKNNAAEIDGNNLLGEVFGYHPVYLAEIFKERYGKTLHTAILDEKLYLASRLLVYTDDSIEKIAFKTGLSCRSYFCTAFKRRFSISPMQYRNKHRIAVM